MGKFRILTLVFVAVFIFITPLSTVEAYVCNWGNFSGKCGCAVPCATYECCRKGSSSCCSDLLEQFRDKCRDDNCGNVALYDPPDCTHPHSSFSCGASAYWSTIPNMPGHCNFWTPYCGANCHSGSVCQVPADVTVKVHFLGKTPSSTFWLKVIDKKTDSVLAVHGLPGGFSHEPAIWAKLEWNIQTQCGKRYILEHRAHTIDEHYVWDPCAGHRGGCHQTCSSCECRYNWANCNTANNPACSGRCVQGGMNIIFQSNLILETPDCPHDAACISHTIPTLMYPTQTKNVSVVMRNTGLASSVWTSPNFTLRPVQNVWTTTSVNLATAGASIYSINRTPRQEPTQARFDFNITAPSAGSYNGAWQMYNQSTAFGAVCGPTVVVQNPSCIFQNPPTDPHPLNVFVDGQLAVCANLDIQPATSPRPPVARSHWTITDSSIARLPNDTGSATTQGSACTTIFGVKTGQTTLRVTVELTPSGTCAAQDIPITVRNRPWWRVYGGNVTAAGGNVVDPLPESTYDYICNRSSSPSPPRTPLPLNP